MQKSHLNSPFLRLLDDMLVSNSSADGMLLSKEMDGLLQKWIEALPEKRKKIFLLRFRDRLSTHEIAYQLDVSQKTVQNQLGLAGTWIKKNIDGLLMILISIHGL